MTTIVPGLGAPLGTVLAQVVRDRLPTHLRGRIVAQCAGEVFTRQALGHSVHERVHSELAEGLAGARWT